MSSIRILDGAMGTELIAKGCRLPNFIWSADTNITNPNLVYEIHRKYIDAGADYITTNTFRTTSRSFLKTGCTLEESKKNALLSLNNALEMAQKAKKYHDVQILASIAPLEDCYIPEKYPGDEVANYEFTELSNHLMNQKIDGFILETMNNISETIACLKIISEFNLPIWLSFNLLDSTHLLSGENIDKAIQSVSPYPVDALLLNCNSIKDTLPALETIKKNWKKEWGVYPNLGLGKPSPDGIIENFSSTDNLLELSEKAVELGASILGGCCGSNAEHIQSLVNKFK